MNYLITGATGFIGPHLVKRLVSDGHVCRCLVRDPGRGDVLKQSGASMVVGDITDPVSLKGVAEGVDVLLHLATLGHMSNFVVTESMFFDVNVQGTIHVMNEALSAGVPRIVHCSSVAAMGICPDVPADEKSSCRPHHPYGRSKLQAEQAVLKLVADRGLPAVIVRFSMVYGPGDGRDILRLTRLAKKGLFPKIGNTPKLTPLIHVDDAIAGLLLASENGRIGEIYLLTNPRSEAFDHIRQIMQQALGIRRLPLYVPEWAALMAASGIERLFQMMGKAPPVTRKNIESTLADRVFSIEKARQELNFSPGVDPDEGLAQTVRWYKKQGWV
ncbi:MAG: NAD-dependent epimerase/dehydratase family protein [Desulfatirhabdiaceae bacterium]